MKTNACIVLGVALLLYGGSGFRGARAAGNRLGDSGQRAEFPTDARIEIAIGGALVASGWLFRRRAGQ